MNPETTTKPGVKTSEFWLVILFTALANFGPIAQSIEGPWAAVANGIVIGLYAIARGHAKKVGVVIPLLLAGLFAIGMTSCVNSYQVDGSGLDWEAEPVQVLGSDRVTPLVDVPLPDQIGGGSITVPIVIAPDKP